MTEKLLPQVRLERLQYLRELMEHKRDLEEGGGVKRSPWREVARPEQLAPEGEWFCWLLLAGRGLKGFGKTRAAAEWVLEKARRYPGARIALVGSTIADVRDTMIEGNSGILNCMSQHELKDGSIDSGWNRSLVELKMANKSQLKGFSSEKPWKLRGPQFNFAWGDEACFWADASKGTVTDTTWTNLTIATRLPATPPIGNQPWDEDYRTQIVIATTPRPVLLLRTTDPDPARAGLMQRPDTAITRGRTVDNLANLSDSYKATVIAPMMGTRLGRQELDAELLEERDDGLWKRQWIEETRMPADAEIEFSRVVVAVDPAVSDGEGSAETGIIVAGADRRGHGYVIADETMRGSPDVVMRKVVAVYHQYQADRVVAEVNNGGDYIGAVLRAIDANVPYRTVRATRGKTIRAEPVSALFEQRRVHFLGTFPQLEDQLCTWAPSDAESPDRLDSCFTESNQILTERGNIWINEVVPGDSAWTRQGWKEVLGVRCSNPKAEVGSVVLSNGRVLTGTPDHMVWTENDDWMRLDRLSTIDTLSGWKSVTLDSGEAKMLGPAPVHVMRSFMKEDPQPVYDLMVEDAHEFVANGVIAHNCVWAFYDLKDLVTASWLEAYNVQKCTKCTRPLFRVVDGKPRTHCPFCGAMLEEAA